MNTEQKIKEILSALDEIARGLELALLNASCDPSEIRSSDRTRMEQAANRLPALRDSLRELNE